MAKATSTYLNNVRPVDEIEKLVSEFENSEGETPHAEAMKQENDSAGETPLSQPVTPPTTG